MRDSTRSQYDVGSSRRRAFMAACVERMPCLAVLDSSHFPNVATAAASFDLRIPSALPECQCSTSAARAANSRRVTVGFGSALSVGAEARTAVCAAPPPVEVSHGAESSESGAGAGAALSVSSLERSACAAEGQTETVCGSALLASRGHSGGKRVASLRVRHGLNATCDGHRERDRRK